MLLGDNGEWEKIVVVMPAYNAGGWGLGDWRLRIGGWGLEGVQRSELSVTASANS